jgi:phosphoglycerol transferase MdoB-like AlkP superfamily enzyme
MKTNDQQRFNGLSYSLKQHGYQTAFFTTHDGQFDNMAGFLRGNYFDKIITDADYPADKNLGSLGVPDDYMFEYGLPLMNEMAASQKPFLAVYLTASDHGPYVVPDYFHPRNKDIKQQIVEYADWSLRKLIELSVDQPWFDSTIFVFVADHGSWLGSSYDMPLSYHHSPLIYYSPSLIQPQRIDKIGGQIDAFPTLMGLLNLPYVNNSFGIDLLKEDRPYIYFSSDFKYGMINDSLYLILGKDHDQKLHRYKHHETEDVSSRSPDEISVMKRYAQSHMQASQAIRDRGLTFYKE